VFAVDGEAPLAVQGAEAAVARRSLDDPTRAAEPGRFRLRLRASSARRSRIMPIT
jgi:hypothetical protein